MKFFRLLCRDKNEHILLVNDSILQEKYCCAIVPAYNNAGTLEKVLTDVAQYLPYIIVVNDGSTDHTSLLLRDLQQRLSLDVIDMPVNRGKGNALRRGFAQTVEAGFRYAITIDADGQHYADDIPLFTAMIEKYPDSLIVGARNMQQEGVPGKSSFGNRFSNFWYRLETGIKLPDTQSGFRLYPVQLLNGMWFFTRKYEFEIEVLVRAAWAGCRVRWIPVKVYYAPEESRVSHFRPIRDFIRISLLNTVLVLLALLWFRPRNMVRNFKWQTTKRFIHSQFVNRKNSPAYIGLSAGFGTFMGIIPIWGVQLVAGVALAHIMKLNKAIVFIACNISLPPMIPIIVYLSTLTGGWTVGKLPYLQKTRLLTEWIVDKLPFPQTVLLKIGEKIVEYFVGSIVFAIAMGIVVTLSVWLSVHVIRKKKNQ